MVTQMADYWHELSNYCPKHNQRYMRFVKYCPVCMGEVLAKNPRLNIHPPPISPEYIPNKTGLFTIQGQPPADPVKPRPARPEQLSLF